jgi:serine/threonine-protein kinase
MDRIGRYKIVRELGRGAMGVVYHAIDPNIGRPVAIKTIQLASVRNSEEQKRLRERLFREARSAGMLSHPGIVTVYDVEQQDDLAYIAMEYVDGPTLDQLLSGPQPLAPEQIFSILAQTAAALDYAHQKGIVHRDIKPANIMIAGGGAGRAGTAKITDFGIAKVTASEQFTMTGSIVGTPHYMSPEQVQGQPVDGRSDQFSLAVIAFEILTGEKPYTGEHLTTVVYKIVAEEPAPPHRLNATLSSAIESVLRKGLAKKPDARYRTCVEFVDALEKACAASKGWRPMARGGTLNEPTQVRISHAATTLPPPRHPRHGETTATVEPGRRRKSSFIPFLLAILMAAALLALIGWQGGVPWLTPGGAANRPGNTASQVPLPDVPAPAVPPAASATGTPPASQEAPQEAKPSPMPPAMPADTGAKSADNPPDRTAPAEAPSVTKPAVPPAADTATPETQPPTAQPSAQPASPRRTASRPAPVTQPVSFITSPGGATVTLDGRAGAACTTPCSLDAAPGRHTIAVTMPGYQVEYREVDVGSGPVELPAVILRTSGGTLMLSTAPPGAAILVNGKRSTQFTPAPLSLAPGIYKITVEKDGLSNTSTVEIHNGETKILKVVLEQ